MWWCRNITGDVNLIFLFPPLFKRLIWRYTSSHCWVFQVKLLSVLGAVILERKTYNYPKCIGMNNWQWSMEDGQPLVMIFQKPFTPSLLSPRKFLSLLVYYKETSRNICEILAPQFSVFIDRQMTLAGIEIVGEGFNWTSVWLMTEAATLCLGL